MSWGFFLVISIKLMCKMFTLITHPHVLPSAFKGDRCLFLALKKGNSRDPNTEPVAAVMIVALETGRSCPRQTDPFTETRRSLRSLVRSMLAVSGLIKTPPSALTLCQWQQAGRDVCVCVWGGFREPCENCMTTLSCSLGPCSSIIWGD